MIKYIKDINNLIGEYNINRDKIIDITYRDTTTGGREIGTRHYFDPSNLQSSANSIKDNILKEIGNDFIYSVTFNKAYDSYRPESVSLFSIPKRA